MGAANSWRSGSSGPRRRAPATSPGWRAASVRRGRRSRRRSPPARGRGPRRRSRPAAPRPRCAERIPIAAGAPRRSEGDAGRSAAVDLAARRERQPRRAAPGPPAACSPAARRRRTGAARRAPAAPRRRPARGWRRRRPPAAARGRPPRAPGPPPRAPPGGAASAASISPSSMRKPRTLTCSSTRPRYSRLAVRQAARQVAGAVEPRPGRAAPAASTPRIGHEALGGQLRPAEIAARQAGAADVQLARHARSAPAAPPASSRWTARSGIGRPITLPGLARSRRSSGR